MAENDQIVVTEEAREIMRGLETNDPGAPSAYSATAVTGASMSDGAQVYREQMRQFMDFSHGTFENLLRLVRRDCANAIEAIDDLHRQDQEIVELLQKYDAETAAAATTNSAAAQTFTSAGGGPKVQAPTGGSSDTTWE